MKDVQTPDHVSLSGLISRLRDGRFVIPDFQREFEWQPKDIRDLMRSIFLDYYIGSLLLWKGDNKNYDALSCEPIYGFVGKEKREHIVLDGQQRLSAMYYVFLAPEIPLPTRTNRYYFFIRVDSFMAEEYDKAFDYNWSKYWANHLNDSEWQYSEHVFPLAVVGYERFGVANWLQGYEQYWRNKAIEAKETGNNGQYQQAVLHAENAFNFSEYIESLIHEYQISYIELDQELGIDKVCDMFTQINSKGIPLDTFDLINALLKPKGIQLKKMWHTASKNLELIETSRMNIYILQVMSIIKQGYCSARYLYFLLPGQEKSIRDSDGTRRKDVLIADSATFINAWNQAVNALENAINIITASSGIRCNLIRIPPLFFDYSGVLCNTSAYRNIAC